MHFTRALKKVGRKFFFSTHHMSADVTTTRTAVARDASAESQTCSRMSPAWRTRMQGRKRTTVDVSADSQGQLAEKTEAAETPWN